MITMAAKQYHIKVGLASCGIAAGAQQVYEQFQGELSHLNSEKVHLMITGCLGTCFCEPLVEISTDTNERYLYGRVTPEDVPRIVQQHILDRKSVV